VSLAHLFTLCPDHPCSNCSKNLSESSLGHLLFKSQTKLDSFVQKNGVCSCFVPGLLSNMPNLTIHVSPCHSSIHRLFPRTNASSVLIQAMCTTMLCGSTAVCPGSAAGDVEETPSDRPQFLNYELRCINHQAQSQETNVPVASSSAPQHLNHHQHHPYGYCCLSHSLGIPRDPCTHASSFESFPCWKDFCHICSVGRTGPELACTPQTLVHTCPACPKRPLLEHFLQN
jgi:hypothetical protein